MPQPMPAWPYRQNDPAWKREVMWDRDAVVQVHRTFNHATKKQAEAVLHRYPRGGNDIGNEGCLLTCLAMVLRLIGPRGHAWTPKTLNQSAQRELYYTRAGLSMTP